MGVVCVGCQMTTPNGFPWPIQPAAQPAPAPNKNRTVVALKNHERLRVLASTNIIVQFLKVFFKLKGESTSWMKNAGKRYCLFLQLSQENPNTVLIPTADILFVQLCHITRAKKYFQDIPDIIIPYNIFAPQPNFLQNAFKTVKLWEEKFNEPYIRMSQRDIPTIARPPFLACFGPTVQETFAGLSISLTVEQLKNDTAWFATLSGEMLKFSNHYGLSEYDSLVKLTYFYDDFLKLAKITRIVWLLLLLLMLFGARIKPLQNHTNQTALKYLGLNLSGTREILGIDQNFYQNGVKQGFRIFHF